VIGVLAALFERERSGQGQVVDAAILDGTASLATVVYAWIGSGRWDGGQRGVNILDTGAPWYDVYETSDGGHMSVGAIEPQFYAELVRLLELTDLPDQDDTARWPELRQRFAERFAQRTRDEWAELFDGTDACVAPVLSFLEAPHHPHVAARGTITEQWGIQQPAPAPRFSRTPGAFSTPPALPGQHSREVLAD
jgi:alpha-methylacyl-CoA racemase